MFYGPNILLVNILIYSIQRPLQFHPLYDVFYCDVVLHHGTQRLPLWSNICNLNVFILLLMVMAVQGRALIVHACLQQKLAPIIINKDDRGEYMTLLMMVI